MKPALQKKFDGQLEVMFLYRQLTTLDTSRCASLTLDAMRVRPVNRQEAATLLREFELSSLERELATLIRDGRVAVEHDASETVDSGKSGSMRQLSLLDTPKAEPRQRLRDASDPFFDALEGNPVAVLGGHGELAIAVGDKEIVYTGLTPKLVDRLLKAKFVIAPDVKALLHTHADWGRIPPEKWFDLGLRQLPSGAGGPRLRLAKLSARWGTALGLSAANPGLLALTMTDQLLKRLSGAPRRAYEDARTAAYPGACGYGKRGRQARRGSARRFSGRSAEGSGPHHRGRLPRGARAVQHPFRTAGSRTCCSPPEAPLFCRQTRGGQASTSQDVLEKLSGHHPVVDAPLEFRKLEKLRSTYLEPLPRLMGGDGRIRTTFNQLATATGRLSSSNPESPEYPRCAERSGRRMRACFTAPEGKKLISADYSQIELRVLAHLSRDEGRCAGGPSAKARTSMPARPASSSTPRLPRSPRISAATPSHQLRADSRRARRAGARAQDPLSGGRVHGPLF